MLATFNKITSGLNCGMFVLVFNMFYNGRVEWGTTGRGGTAGHGNPAAMLDRKTLAMHDLYVSWGVSLMAINSAVIVHQPVCLRRQ